MRRFAEHRKGTGMTNQYGGYPGPGTFSRPGGYQQSGGHPQQGVPSYGEHDPTRQFPQGGGRFGQPPAVQPPAGPPQPPKNNAGPILGIIAAVVAILATLGITAFVTPGFLVSHHDDEAGSPSGGSTTVPTEPQGSVPGQTLPTLPPGSVPPLPTELPSSGGPVVTATTGRAAITAFLAKVNAGDKAGALSRACLTSRGLLDSTVGDAIENHAKVQATGVDENDVLVIGELTGTVAGRQATGTVSATNFDHTGFCVSTFIAF